MSTYRFVHVSDIHFGQEVEGRLVIHEDVRTEVLRDCANMANEILGPANGILVLGDTACSGKRDQYEQAGEWLDRLTSEVGCSQIAVYVVPGNHDIDLNKIDYAGQMVQNVLRNASLQDLDRHLEGIAKGNETGNPLLPKFVAYREFAARYDCDFISPLEPFWKKRLRFGDCNKLQIVGLNSVQVSDRDDAPDRMVLGNIQYTLPRETGLETMVMIHHPVHWLKDRAQARRYLSRARVLLWGHEHQSEILKIADGGEERLEIHAGAITPPERGEPYKYCYNWIEIKSVVDGARYQILVTVYPRVWKPSETKFVADKARCLGEESVSHQLLCPNFKDQKGPNSFEDISEGSGMSESVTSPREPQMASGEFDCFARLRYFFWKYLNWRQRLEVLVEVDILPSGTSQPVPQTMERLALNTARDQGKLRQLWEAVMEMVPEDKREANPFDPK